MSAEDGPVLLSTLSGISIKEQEIQVRIYSVLILSVLCASAHASGEMEQVRSGNVVTYSNGDSVEVKCRSPDTCSLSITHRGVRVTLEEDDLDGLVVLPRHVTLITASDTGRSVVEVEVGCAAYAEAPPPYICIAQFELKAGKLVSTDIFKRTFLDSHYAVPFREEAAMPAKQNCCASIRIPSETSTDLKRSFLSEQPTDGGRFRTRGFAAVTFGGVYLFTDKVAAERGEFFGGLDLVRTDSLARRLAQGGACVEVMGVFLAFNDDSVGSGYLRSDIGLIELEEIRTIPCEQIDPAN